MTRKSSRRTLRKPSGWPSGLRRQTQGKIPCIVAMTFHGRSGLHLEAWVRIPLLIESFCEKLRFIQINDRKEELLSMDFGVIRSHASCIGHKRKQAMDNIIMNCQRNDSKMQNSQIVQPSFHISRGIFF